MSNLCPVCHYRLRENFTWKGILWAIFCFPCGLFCCIRRRKLKCRHCGTEVIISNGSVPTIVEAYKHYKDFKWQFPSKHKTHSDTRPAVENDKKEEENTTNTELVTAT